MLEWRLSFQADGMHWRSCEAGTGREWREGRKQGLEPHLFVKCISRSLQRRFSTFILASEDWRTFGTCGKFRPLLLANAHPHWLRGRVIGELRRE
jgi:hypothetical protein